MFRHRVRTPTPPFDEATAERLLGGAPSTTSPTTSSRSGGSSLPRRRPATPDELDGSAAAAAAFVAAHHAANRTLPRRTRSMVASVLTVLTVVASTGTAVAATQGVLPEPVQQVAHEALGVVGIHVPGITSGGDRRRRRRRRRLGEHCAVDDLRHDDDQRRAERRGGAVGHGRCERYANRVWERERDRRGARGAVGPDDHDRPGQRRPGQRVRRRRQFGSGTRAPATAQGPRPLATRPAATSPPRAMAGRRARRASRRARPKNP